MTSDRQRQGPRSLARSVFASALLLALTAAAAAAGDLGPQPPLARLLIGNTLSAVTYVPRPPDAPGGGQLSRLMVQAYLRGDGSALVRIWDIFANSYTVPVDRPWALNGSTLCLDLPKVPHRGFPPSICADIHIWGPRIAGIGVKPYAMLDGDLQPGNLIVRNP